MSTTLSSLLHMTDEISLVIGRYRSVMCNCSSSHFAKPLPRLECVTLRSVSMAQRISVHTIISLCSACQGITQFMVDPSQITTTEDCALADGFTIVGVEEVCE